MAVPSFVTIGTPLINTNTSSLTPPLPGTRANGNLLLAKWFVNGTGKVFTLTGAGWVAGTTENTLAISTFWASRIVDGTEAAPTASWTGNAICGAVEIQYTGQAASFAGAELKAVGTGTTWSSGGMTSTANNSLFVGQAWTTANPTITPTTTYWTSRQTASRMTTSDGIMYLSGTTCNSFTGTYSASSTWCTSLIEIKGSGTTANEPQIHASQVVYQILRTVDTQKHSFKKQIRNYVDKAK